MALDRWKSPLSVLADVLQLLGFLGLTAAGVLKWLSDLRPEWIGVSVIVSGMAIALGWRFRRSRNTATAPKTFRDGDDVEVELLRAIMEIALRSAWARWFQAQHLATNEHRPASEFMLLNDASGLLLQALMNGQVAARGRPPNAVEYVQIPKEVWRLAAIMVEPHAQFNWRARIIPRDRVDPGRIAALLGYDSILVPTEKIEELWPRVDRSHDRARAVLLKKAQKAGVAEILLKRVSDLNAPLY